MSFLSTARRTCVDEHKFGVYIAYLGTMACLQMAVDIELSYKHQANVKLTWGSFQEDEDATSCLRCGKEEPNDFTEDADEAKEDRLGLL